MTSLLLLLTLAASPDSAPPPCAAPLLGTFWPHAANTNRNLARDLARQGKLKICSYSSPHWAWISPTVSLQELKAKPPRLSVSWPFYARRP